MGTKDAAKPDATPPTDGVDDEKKALFAEMTDEQRADMTDEELAGIDGDDDEDHDDGDGGDDKGDAEEAGKGDDESDDDDGEEDDSDDEDGEKGQSDKEDTTEADADAGDDESDAGEDETGEDDEEDPLDVTRSVMPDEWQSLPKDADEQVAALKQQRADIADKFDAGDLTAREYQQQRDKLDEDIFKREIHIHDATKAINKAHKDWVNRTVKGFLREPEHKKYATNATLNRMLDAEVRALQQATNDPFNPRILRKAHANIQAALGNAPEPKGDGKKAKPAAKEKTPVVAGKKPQVPPTLARVPQDEIEDADGGKFARLNRLSSKDPHAFEEAFARLSPADQDAYLAGA